MPDPDVMATPETEVKPSVVATKPEPTIDPELVQRLQNKIHAYDRILSTQRQELDALKQKVSAPPPEPPAPVLTQDAYDKLVDEGKWKEAVKGLGKEVATQVYHEMFAQQQAQQQRQQFEPPHIFDR